MAEARTWILTLADDTQVTVKAPCCVIRHGCLLFCDQLEQPLEPYREPQDDDEDDETEATPDHGLVIKGFAPGIWKHVEQEPDRRERR